MKDKTIIILLLFGTFVSLMTLYIHNYRQDRPPVMAAAKGQAYREAMPEQEEKGEVAPVQPAFTPININLSTDLQEWIYNNCLSNNISPALVFAIIEKESNYDINAVGDDGESVGLMQINIKWHRKRMERLGVTEPAEERQNITIGVDYLLELFRENPETEWVLNAYNGGQDYAYRIQEKGITTDYAKDILRRAVEIEKEITGCRD